MKKSLLITAIAISSLMLINTLSLVAATPDLQKSTREDMRREIIRHIDCPDFITTESPTNEVRAIVSISDEGMVSVEEINSANAQLKTYVMQHLQNMQLRHTGTADKFVLVIKFKVA